LADVFPGKLLQPVFRKKYYYSENEKIRYFKLSLCYFCCWAKKLATRLKILFLCSSLERGKDGVGDYTSCLAAELRLRGHDSLCFAINDHHLKPGVNENVLLLGSKHFRFSRQISWTSRIQLLQNAVTEFQPDWISLQYVPNGFHYKGLPFLLSKRLASLGGGFFWHVMFHELWYGDAPGSKVKHFLIYLLQRFIIQRLISELNPQQMHTHINLFMNRLQTLGACPRLLPLFGNIPVVESPPKPWGVGSPHLTKEQQSRVKCGVFGAVHPGSIPARVLSEVVDTMNRRGKKIIFIHFGGIGGERGLAAWNSAMLNLPQGVEAVVLGQQPAERISAILQQLDLGLATTPLSIAGKSGTVAAMREHGLPVIFGAPDPFAVQQRPLGCFPATRAGIESALAMERQPSSETASGVARQFIADLERAADGFCGTQPTRKQIT
jgi:hypothetical protein